MRTAALFFFFVGFGHVSPRIETRSLKPRKAFRIENFRPTLVECAPNGTHACGTYWEHEPYPAQLLSSPGCWAYPGPLADPASPPQHSTQAPPLPTANNDLAASPMPRFLSPARPLLWRGSVAAPRDLALVSRTLPARRPALSRQTCVRPCDRLSRALSRHAGDREFRGRGPAAQRRGANALGPVARHTFLNHPRML